MVSFRITRSILQQTCSRWPQYYTKPKLQCVLRLWSQIIRTAASAYSVYSPQCISGGTQFISEWWHGSDLLPVSSLHTCTSFLCGYSLKKAAVWQYRLGAKIHQRIKFAWHPSPTGANYPVTQPAVEIKFHLFTSWCSQLHFQGTEELFSVLNLSSVSFPFRCLNKSWCFTLNEMQIRCMWSLVQRNFVDFDCVFFSSSNKLFEQTM